MACSTLTIIALILTSCLYSHYSTATLSTLFLDVPLAILWIVTVSLLGWDMSEGLTAACTNEIWGSRDAVVACRLLKALFSFTVVGAASATATVVLGIVAIRRQSRKGAYNVVREDSEHKRVLLGQSNEMMGMRNRSRSRSTSHEEDESVKMMTPEGENDVSEAGHPSGMNTTQGGYGYAPPPGPPPQIRVNQFANPPSRETRYDVGGE
jgi:hypothetical protein